MTKLKRKCVQFPVTPNSLIIATKLIDQFNLDSNEMLGTGGGSYSTLRKTCPKKLLPRVLSFSGKWKYNYVQQLLIFSEKHLYLCQN